MPKWLDLPPLWLILMAAIMYVGATAIAPWPNTPLPWTGGLLIALGVALAVWAGFSFKAQKTTIVPHQSPSALITKGPFAFSRNPIYLADVVVLIGWGVWLGAALPFLMVLIFIWILTIRFITPEEERLRIAFGDEFTAYAARVRRWI